MDIGTFLNRSAISGKKPKPVAVDIPLLLAVITLCVFGLLMLYSASWDFSNYVYENPSFMFNKQVVWMVLGAITAFILARLDYHIWRKYATLLMGITLILLVAVLINNEIRLGAVRTFFGGSVQPSELAKLTTIIYLSVWLYAKRESLHDIQLGLIPLGIIQPDLSATVTLFFLGGLLFFLAGGELRQIVLFLILAVAAGWVVVQFSDTGRERIASYILALKNPLEAHFQVRLSLRAIILGKFFGVGLGNSSTKLGPLPVPPTDSIFAVVVEELGLLGAIGLVGLYGVLLWRGIKIAKEAPDSLGSVMAAGCTFWIAMEAFINMGVMVSLFPIAGNALPFISAGGSNLISSLAAIGILFNISRKSRASAPEAEERRNYSATADLRRRNGRRSVSRPHRTARCQR
jgi:cell division protein FtsW